MNKLRYSCRLSSAQEDLEIFGADDGCSVPLPLLPVGELDEDDSLLSSVAVSIFKQYNLVLRVSVNSVTLNSFK